MLLVWSTEQFSTTSLDLWSPAEADGGQSVLARFLGRLKPVGRGASGLDRQCLHLVILTTSFFGEIHPYDEAFPFMSAKSLFINDIERSRRHYRRSPEATQEMEVRNARVYAVPLPGDP